MKKIVFLLLIMFMLVFSGCSSSSEGEKTAQESDISSKEDATGAHTPATSEDDLDPSERLLVSKSKEDLAKKLDIGVEEIEFVAFRPVVWGDGSLGCPKPGMAYKQVLVDGYSILLKVGDIYYDYHGGGQREPFLCKAKGSYNSLTPVPPHPADQ